MRYLIILLLSSCSIFEPKIITKEVKVPVPVACIATLPEQYKPTHTLTQESNIYDKVKVLSMDKLGYEAEVIQLRALVIPCLND